MRNPPRQQLLRCLVLLVLVCALDQLSRNATILYAADQAVVPGVVIDYSAASSGIYIGSPSLAVLANGDYVASHDEFGPKSTEHSRAVSHIFQSRDRGAHWKKIATIDGAFWSTLFTHRGALYLLGPDKHYGNVLIRRSPNGGVTWTSPTNGTTGLLRGDGQYHCAPVPVIEHAGRLWRAMEWRNPPIAWGINYRAGMLSIPVDADLLNAANWTCSNFLPSERAWNGGDMGAWLEGNAVLTPAGELVDVLRVQTKSPDEKAACRLHNALRRCTETHRSARGLLECGRGRAGIRCADLAGRPEIMVSVYPPDQGRQGRTGDARRVPEDEAREGARGSGGGAGQGARGDEPRRRTPRRSEGPT